MRTLLAVLLALSFPLTPAVAQVSIQIGAPNLSIGIAVPVYPRLVLVPGYPVYWAPGLNANYFFYDGMYWVYEGDGWYASSWYNGPWAPVAPEAVPVFLLRVPVRYYRQPPPYFRAWRHDAPPRWGERWGHDWEERRRGWDRWNRRAVPAPAPLPAYQRRYPADRYPQAERQPGLHGQHYRYHPRDVSVREAYQAHGLRSPPPSPGRDRGHEGGPRPRGPGRPRGEGRGQGDDR